MESGDNRTFPAPIYDINVLLRGGNIIPGESRFPVIAPLSVTASTNGLFLFPAAQDIGANTLSGNRKNGFILVIAPDAQRSAKGQLFWDDGETLGSYFERPSLPDDSVLKLELRLLLMCSPTRSQIPTRRESTPL